MTIVISIKPRQQFLNFVDARKYSNSRTNKLRLMKVITYHGRIPEHQVYEAHIEKHDVFNS